MAELKDLGLQSLKLNINDSIIEPIFAKEGDKKSRGLNIQILNHNTEIDTTGIDVEMYAVGRDKQPYKITATAIDTTKGRYQIVYPSQILQSGTVLAELVLRKDDAVISSKKFKIEVEGGLVTDSAIEGHDAYPLFKKLLDAANKIDDLSEEQRIKNEDLRETNEDQRIVNEDNRKAAEEKRVLAEANRVDSEQKRNNAENIRESNENIRKENEVTRENSENIRKTNEEQRIINENARQTSENERDLNEIARLENEDSRKINESTRQTNEDQRIENEVIRQTQEQQRQESMTDIENRFNLLETSQQQDAEVINARTSTVKGKTFNSLNDRLEETEKEIDKLSGDLDAHKAENAEELLVRTPPKYGNVKLPSDFIDVDFELYRNPNGKVIHDINLDRRYRNLDFDEVIYTSISDGNNLIGDGSESNPYFSPVKAFEHIANSSASNFKVVIDAEELLRYELVDGGLETPREFINKKIVVTSKDNKVIPFINGDSSKRTSWRTNNNNVNQLADWTLESGNVYRNTRSNTAYVVDTTYRNPFNDNIMKMTRVYSIDGCERTAGSYFIDGNTVYVHTFDSRKPDGNIVCCLKFTTNFLMFQLRNSDIFIENIDFFIHSGVTVRGDENSLVVFNNCDFGETIENNSFSMLHTGKTYMLNCSTHDSYLDGFNYHYPTGINNRDRFVFEYNCYGYNNGNEAGGTGNNYSTIHDGASILRVHSFGEDSQGVVCADVNGSYSILIDCQMENSKLPSNNIRSASYQFTTDSGILPAKAVLINSSGASPNWSILTDEQNGTNLVLESWFEGLDKIKRDVSL